VPLKVIPFTHPSIGNIFPSQILSHITVILPFSLLLIHNFSSVIAEIEHGFSDIFLRTFRLCNHLIAGARYKSCERREDAV